MQATTEELWGKLFPMRSVPKLYSEGHGEKLSTKGVEVLYVFVIIMFKFKKSSTNKNYAPKGLRVYG
jgi:hypothetical protein